MQIFLTIISGVTVYVIGQAILNFILQPIAKFNEQRGDTSYLLLFWNAKPINASSNSGKAPKDVQEMGSALVSTMSMIPFYGTLSRCGLFSLPARADVMEAAKMLNSISHSKDYIGPQNQNQKEEAVDKIARLLKIEAAYSKSETPA